MKKLIFVVTAVFSLITLSCEPEHLGPLFERTGAGSTDGDFESSYENPYDLKAEEKAALQINWEKGSHLYFKDPMMHDEDIIYYDRDLKSINMLTGMINWTTNLDYITHNEKAIRYEDAIYLVGSDKIFGVDLNTGDLIFEYKWPGHENLHDEILIHDGVMYVSLNDCDYTYSSFAYCPINNLRSGEWIYFNRKDTAGDETKYTSIREKVMYTNTDKHKVIIAMTSIGSRYTPNTRVEMLEAFNVNTNEIEWTSEESSGQGFLGQMLLYEDQLIVRGRDYLMGIDQKTGSQLWDKDVNEYANSLSQGSTFFIDEDILYLFNLKNVIVTYSNDTSKKEVARAYDLNQDVALMWKSYATADAFQEEQGIRKSTFNIVEDKIYYISDHGYLMDMDISNGDLTRYHEELKFKSGIFVTPEKEIIAIPELSSALLSFTLE